MFSRFILILPFVLCVLLSHGQEETQFVISLHKGKLNKKTAVIREANHQKGVALRANLVEGYPDRSADVEVEVAVPRTGWYVLETEAHPRDVELLKKEDSTGRLTRYAYFQLGAARPTKRIVYDTQNGSNQKLGKFEMSAGKQTLKIWLPPNLVSHTIKVSPYYPPVAPPEAEAYVPSVVPPGGRPRLWMNQETLPVIRGRLRAKEHQAAWKNVSAKALTPYTLDFDIEKEVFYDETLEQAIEQKAFYYLMTEDRNVGLEAVDLASKYLSVLEFGNISYGDITRELGRAIYIGSLVYDWCYNLMDDSVRSSLRTNLMRLTRDMAIGWPPFHGLESIINGHGNEAQICRDLLSMSIAIYDEDPTPYQYVSYSVLEQLVPMRKFEYQSPRHNQGVDYGGYRFGWEMHAVWLYYRMLGFSVFDDNIKNMSDYWLYMRTPDGKMLRDGDMFNVKYSNSDDFYWKNPQTMLLCYAFSGDPMIKAEFLKQGGLPDNPVLYLMLNDPVLRPDFDRSKLPLSRDFGQVLGSMIARTGWSEDKASSDVVAEIKGGGYHFGNHQHADAGALQVYFHGIQMGDLGLYLSYGSPYDFNFNKRSVAHSMMLVRDPNEELLFRTRTNDGGTRFSQRFPRTVDELLNDSWYHTGFVRSSAIGPDPIAPSYSYFNVDLTAAYSTKISAYSKSFLFMNMKRADVPAIILLWDDVTSNDADFKKYWQINTIEKPKVTTDRIQLNSSFAEKSGATYVNMLKPSVDDRQIQVLNGDSSTFVFGDQYTVKSPWPEAKGSRIMVSPKTDNRSDQFLTLFQMVEEGAAELPVIYEDKVDYVYCILGQKIIILSKPSQLLKKEITFSVPNDSSYEVVIAGVIPGFWNVRDEGKRTSHNVSVLKDKHVISFKSDGGQFTLTPTRTYGGEEGRPTN